jgi:outer membrane cobalamin receptor
MIIYSTSSFVNAQGAVETKGLESFYRLNIGKSLKAQITYTFLTFGNNRDGSDIKIPRHQVAGDISSHLSENCSLSLSSQWVSQRKSYKKVTSLKSYTLTHMKVRYKIRDHWHTYLKVHNMFNTSYETSLGYRMPRRGIYVGTTLTF